MTGNRLGPKKNYIYITDISTVGYIIPRDEDLAVAGLGVGAAAPEEFDPENPPPGITLTAAPKRFNPRVVFVQSTTDGARKEMIAFSPTANLYTTQSRTQFPAIDTDSTFFSTGRKGETLTF